MDPGRVDELFDAALELPEDERHSFLDAACAGNEALGREVRALLAASEEAERVLGESLTDFAGPLLDELARSLRAEESVLPPGIRIGPWRVVRELGRGGMGLVYLAERDDGAFSRQVALKVVKRGMDTDEILLRFRYERQILAGLDHPNIAGLLDAGATDDGRPYLVMEYVEGRPIDRYGDEERLDVSERVSLFRAVCDAVEHAHRRLIVHRDLKPSNILVGADGTVKLLDFGIAKLLGPEPDAGAPLTRAEVRIVTPEYGAPEQLLGGAITTATDVYALGVVLYKLLTGRLPHGAHATAPAEWHTTAERDVQRPSSAVQPSSRRGAGGASDEPTPEALAAARRTTTDGLRRRLTGDLDGVLLRALEADPARRYGSATELGEELRRHLAGEPVRARDGDTLYRAGRFVRRHRKGVVAAALAAVTLGAYVVTLLVSAARIDRERALVALEAQRAAGVTEFMVGLFQDPDITGASVDTLTARELLNRGALRLREDTGRLDPGARGAALLALGRAYRGLGDSDISLPLLEEAVSLRRAEAGDFRGLAEALVALASARNDARHFEAADSLYREAVGLQPALSGPDSLQLAAWLTGHGGVLRDLGRPDSAVVLTRTALGIRMRHGPADDPGLPAALSDLAYSLRGQGALEEAESMYRQALERERARPAPRASGLARTLNNLGVLLREVERQDEAEAAFREALALAGEALGEDHPRTLVKGMHLAQMLEYRGASDEAEEILLAQVEVTRARWGHLHWSVGQIWFRLGDLVRDHRGDPAAAVPHYRQAVRIFGEALGEGHAWTGSARGALGAAFARSGALAEAERELREAHRILLAVHSSEEHSAVRTARDQLAGLDEPASGAGRTGGQPERLGGSGSDENTPVGGGG